MNYAHWSAHFGANKNDRREPDWSALPTETPPHVRRLLQRCLQKERRRRMRDCGDVTLELDESVSETPAAAPFVRWRLRLAIAGAAGIALGAVATFVGGTMWTPGPANGSSKPGRCAFIASGERLDVAGRLSIAVSRDGRRVVYSGNQQLLVRNLDELTPRPIAGTEAVATPTAERGNTGFASQPILSPDGESVAYIQGSQLKRVAIAGGVPAVICSYVGSGATWSDDDSILLATARLSTTMASGVSRPRAARRNG